jgi:hypothetical protein
MSERRIECGQLHASGLIHVQCIVHLPGEWQMKKCRFLNDHEALKERSPLDFILSQSASTF